MNTIRDAARQSTCRKRVTVCVIFDVDGNPLACESNRCDPPEGQCTRVARSDGQAQYPSESGCRWQHAEQRAVAALSESARPVRALLCGHDFPCPDCESALRAVGVTHIDVEPTLFGTGLR